MMSLVAYPDSEEEPDLALAGNALERQDNDTSPASQRLKRKHEDGPEPSRRFSKPAPTLPPGFHSLYASNVRSSVGDDPSLHGGRRRQIPHTVGNWPSFVYLEWLPNEEDLLILDGMISAAAKQIQGGVCDLSTSNMLKSSLRSDLGVRLPLHVSLSAPLTLTTDNKDNFEQELAVAIQKERLSPFTATPAILRWVSNFDQSRYFLILTLRKPQDRQLDTLLSTCNRVCNNFGLPELYMNCSNVGVETLSESLMRLKEAAAFDQALLDMFHISIAWTLKEPVLKAVDGKMVTSFDLDRLAIPFSEVCVKVGNHISVIPFKDN